MSLALAYALLRRGLSYLLCPSPGLDQFAVVKTQRPVSFNYLWHPKENIAHPTCRRFNPFIGANRSGILSGVK
jgi:hypothetical protein